MSETRHSGSFSPWGGVGRWFGLTRTHRGSSKSSVRSSAGTGSVAPVARELLARLSCRPTLSNRCFGLYKAVLNPFSFRKMVRSQDGRCPPLVRGEFAHPRPRSGPAAVKPLRASCAPSQPLVGRHRYCPPFTGEESEAQGSQVISPGGSSGHAFSSAA